jgi:hypothetical protein
MVAFLKRERVDVVVACDMTRKELVSDSHPLSYGARASHPYQMKHGYSRMGAPADRSRKRSMAQRGRRGRCFMAQGHTVSTDTSLPI